MSTTTNQITAGQLWEMGDCPYELLRGKLNEVTSPAGNVHGILMRRLSWILENYIQPTGEGPFREGTPILKASQNRDNRR